MEELWQKSKWFQEQQAKADAEPKKSSKSPAFIFFLLFFSAAGFVAMRGYTPIAIVIAVMGLVFTLIMAVKSKNGTLPEDAIALKYAKQFFDNMQPTDEEIEIFDKEMYAAPLYVFETDKNGNKIWFTEHYICTNMDKISTKNDFAMCRIADIASTAHETTRSAESKLPWDKAHYYDLLNTEGKKIMGINIEGNKRRDQFEEVCAKYAKNVSLEK